MAKKLGELTLAEIGEQPAAWRAVMAARDGLLAISAEALATARPEEIIFTGCGTSYHLAQTVSALFAHYNPLPTRAVAASELCIHSQLYLRDRRTLVVPLTRLSTTTEVRRALAVVRQRPHVTTMAISCDEGSRALNDFCLFSPDAAEKSVVMTKSFSSMLLIGLLFSLHAAGRADLLANVPLLPGLCANLLDKSDRFARQVAEENRQTSLFIYLGHGPLYGVACEATIKMKEMSLAYAEAYHSLEYRHGPIALAGPGTLVTMFHGIAAGHEEDRLIEELGRLGARTLVVSDSAPAEATPGADYYFELGTGLGDFLSAPLAIVPAQLIAYYFAVGKGLDLDTPRHLSQAVVLP